MKNNNKKTILLTGLLLGTPVILGQPTVESNATLKGASNLVLKTPMPKMNPMGTLGNLGTKPSNGLKPINSSTKITQSITQAPPPLSNKSPFSPNNNTSNNLTGTINIRTSPSFVSSRFPNNSISSMIKDNNITGSPQIPKKTTTSNFSSRVSFFENNTSNNSKPNSQNKIGKLNLDPGTLQKLNLAIGNMNPQQNSKITGTNPKKGNLDTILQKYNTQQTAYKESLKALPLPPIPEPPKKVMNTQNSSSSKPSTSITNNKNPNLPNPENDGYEDTKL